MASGGAGPNDSQSGTGQRRSPQQDPHYTNINNNMTANVNMIKVSKLKANEVVFKGNIVFLNPSPMQQWRCSGQDVYDEALRDPPPPEDLTPKFRPQDLEREADQKMFVSVAQAFEMERGSRWLARKLNIDSPTMSKLVMWHGNNVQELVYQVCVSWKKVNPTGTVRDLVQALCQSRNQKQALALKAFLEQKYPDP